MKRNKHISLQVMEILIAQIPQVKKNLRVKNRNLKVKKRSTILKSKMSDVVNQDMPNIWYDMWLGVVSIKIQKRTRFRGGISYPLGDLWSRALVASYGCVL